MNVRHVDRPLVRRAARGLAALNARHPWSHNDHFHGWLLRRLPDGRRAALDVGCGRGGLLVRLAPRFDTVHGVDTDAEMRRAAAEACAALPGVVVDDTPLAALAGPYDLVTMIAVLHHLDAEAALDDVARVLAPGGRFLAVGLAPPETARDAVWDIASAVTNPLIGMVKHPRPARGPAPAPPFPVKDPELAFDELRSVVRRVLPGARMRHRLGFRHTIEWTR